MRFFLEILYIIVLTGLICLGCYVGSIIGDIDYKYELSRPYAFHFIITIYLVFYFAFRRVFFALFKEINELIIKKIGEKEDNK